MIDNSYSKKLIISAVNSQVLRRMLGNVIFLSTLSTSQWTKHSDRTFYAQSFISFFNFFKIFFWFFFVFWSRAI